MNLLVKGSKVLYQQLGEGAGIGSLPSLLGLLTLLEELVELVTGGPGSPEGS